jgi:predicted nucleic acid-binding protein
MSRYLADTNVIVRWVLPHDPLSSTAVGAVDRLLREGHEVSVGHQNLVEFWAVATRPAEVNGLGMSPARAADEVDKIQQFFPTLPDQAEVYGHWRELVGKYAVRGRQVFDARLVAVMLVHGFTHILTFNVDDFTRFSEIEVTDPHSLCGTPA